MRDAAAIREVTSNNIREAVELAHGDPSVDVVLNLSDLVGR